MGIEKATPKDFHITVSGISGSFDTASTVQKSANSRRYQDGGTTTPDILMDRPELGDLTVRRAWSHQRDFAITNVLMGFVGNASRFWTITKQPLRAGQRYGPATVYTGVLKSCTDPEADSNANTDPSMLELVFALTKRS